MKPQIIQYYDDRARCFVDTEFYEDGETIDLISIGAVRSDGEEFYAVNSEAKLHLVSDWVRANVLPKLPPYSDPAWRTRRQIADNFSAFMGWSRSEGSSNGPMVSEVWGYFSDYDWVVICQLYGTMMNLPKHFPEHCLDLKQLSWMLGDPRHEKQDEATAHNALEDARWNRDLFKFLRLYAHLATHHVLQLDEGERQALLLSLAHLANERPGWDDMLNRVALRIDNEDSGHPGRAKMYDEFKVLNTGRDCPVGLLGVRMAPIDTPERAWRCGATIMRTLAAAEAVTVPRGNMEKTILDLKIPDYEAP